LDLFYLEGSEEEKEGRGEGKIREKGGKGVMENRRVTSSA